MFAASADVYDLIYSAFKNYPAETADVAALIRKANPGARTILDVACGTGEHARLLTETHGFIVDGLDLEPGFVRIAQAKVPNATVYEGDMTSFSVPGRYDIVLIFGATVPHEVAGFAGGAKYFFPGVAGPDLTHATHWVGALASIEHVIGRVETPTRHMIEAAADLVPARVISLNSVVTRDDDQRLRTHALFCGDFRQSFRRQGKLQARRHHRGRRRAHHLRAAPAHYLRDAWPAHREVRLRAHRPRPRDGRALDRVALEPRRRRPPGPRLLRRLA